MGGLQSAQSHKGNRLPMMAESNLQRAGLASAKVTKPKQVKGADTYFPPILRPLLNDAQKKSKKIGENKLVDPHSKLKNTEANLIELIERFPKAKTLINMKLKDGAYKDPAD